MKELALKAFKVIAYSFSVLVAAFTIGWSGAMTVHNLFKTEKAEATAYVDHKVDEAKTEVMAIHKVEMDGLHGKMDILIDQNKLIISQNYLTRKAIEGK